ncbi:electron transfer flavoprotein subunit beta/FixA family protein [Magnetospirillum sulfuroxidans]|uniref:Protein FixA n=1 Tax=Magnetospirillum sulfuroxidans TaxID=611300 RepID=A0ABS5I9R9_9PROT|nr:electron transfer flavoprotein subunit beta/FixA family protein [Magnetospirillum sulfuroxidans]MBR9970493.1 electron transfer flavoprotein subunit beta/FixA family protein [Magnetospirillum sulfuroxidans]
MHIVVCIKQVPDSAQIRVHPVTNTIMRQGVPTIINPYDLFSLEEALRLRDQFGGKVTVITMGPKMAIEALKKCISYGADDAILLTDKVFAGSDTLATSFALASTIAKIGETQPVDMVFCGKQTIDGDTAQVGPGIARRLGMQQLTYVAQVETVDLEKREIVAHRRSEGGVQVLQTKLPCLVTMLEGTNTMRFGTMEDLFRAARYEVAEWDHKAAGITATTQCGLKGSPTVVKKVFAPPAKAVKAEMIKTEDKSAREVADALLNSVFAKHPKLEMEIGQ